MAKRKIFSQLRRNEPVFLKEGIDGVFGLTKMTEGYAHPQHLIITLFRFSIV
ncbi:MAG: hypothetical protein ACTSRG_19965 [Candidatus Helarchaeota archaeon]